MKSSGLGNKIKARRAELELTQAALAEMVGVTRKTINTVENRVFTPSAVLALKIAQSLEAPTDEIFFLEADRED